MADHNITCTSFLINQTANQSAEISSATRITSISKSAMTKDGYIVFTVSCGGTKQQFRIKFNATK